MHIQESQGIILRNIKYSETSIIIDIFTEKFGLKSFIIGSVRSAKNKAGGAKYQVMNVVHVSYIYKENDTLIRPREINYAHQYKSIPFDVMKSSVGVFLIECTRNSIKEKEANLSLYSFVRDSFVHLDEISNLHLSKFYVCYLIDLARHLGFEPLNNYDEDNCEFDLLNGSFSSSIADVKYSMDKECSKILSNLLSDQGLYKIDKAIRDRMLDYLLVYYALHVEGFKQIKSLEVLRALMN